MFFNTEETIRNEDLGLPEIALEEHITKDVYIYNIEAISPYTDDASGKTYAKIHIAGDLFISSILFEDIDEEINKQLNGFK